MIVLIVLLLYGCFVLIKIIQQCGAKGTLNTAAWLLNQNPRPCDLYPKKTESCSLVWMSGSGISKNQKVNWFAGWKDSRSKTSQLCAVQACTFCNTDAPSGVPFRQCRREEHDENIDIAMVGVVSNP